MRGLSRTVSTAVARIRPNISSVRHAIWVYVEDDEHVAMLLVREWRHGPYSGMTLEALFYWAEEEPSAKALDVMAVCESDQGLADLGSRGRLIRAGAMPRSAVPAWCRQDH
jgi:hypothetical protein